MSPSIPGDQRQHLPHVGEDASSCPHHATQINVLRESEHHLRVFIDQTPIAIAMFDREMRYLAASRKWVTTYLNGIEDYVGLGHYDLFPECPAKWRAAHARGLVGEVVHVDEDAWTLPDGEQMWAEYEVRPWHAANGLIGGISIYTLDITELKNRNCQLHLSQDILDRTQELAHLGSWHFDLLTDRIVCSGEVYRIFGVANPEGYRTYDRFINAVHPDDRRGVAEAYFSSIAAEVPALDREFRILRQQTGEIRHIHVKCEHMRDNDGQVTASFGMVQDVTQRRQLESEQSKIQERLQRTQRLQSLGVLAGGIAHDFNNLMMGVLGYAELLLADLPENNHAIRNVEAIKRASLQAADLCKQLLAYAGHGKSTEVAFSLNALLEELQELLRAWVAKSCDIRLSLASDLPPIHGDPSQIRQILLNFVMNASEAIGDRPGEISIATGSMNWDEEYLDIDYVLEPAIKGPCVVLEVTDNGCGMDKDTVAEIFEPFFSTKLSGRGLGLSAVIGIMRAHEGGLCVCSRPGQGSTFRVVFPAIDRVLTADRSPTTDGVDSTWTGSGTILLVDDEELVRGATTELLRLLGFQVMTAIDGKHAIDVYRDYANDIDLVLLDLTMPCMSGEQALPILQQINPNVDVIIVSGHSESNFATQFAGRGIVGCLQKPYTLAKLRETLSRLA